MKKALSFSVLLNVILLVSVAIVLKIPRPKASVVLPVIAEVPPSTIGSTAPEASGDKPASFRWSQLISAKDYRLYIANLRAIGCPEVTIADIVRGDTERAFAWERSQLALDKSGIGPWSPQTEKQLVADLLAQPDSVAGSQNAENPDSLNNSERTIETPASSPGAQSGSAGYPLFLQDVNWSALGFTADQQAAIAQVHRQFQSEMVGINQSPGGASSNPGTGNVPALTQQQTALQNATDQLQALLGAQGYEAYQQQQYYAWYQPQVLANAEGGNLTINPKAFH